MGMLTELYRRFQILRHKPSHFLLRPGTIDRRLFREVVIHNAYQLPSRFGPADIILDIGAHVGSFAHAVLKRGAGTVHCCEASPDNFRLLQHNLQPFRDRVRLSPCAIWRSDQPLTQVSFHNPGDPRNTGAGRVTLDPSSEPVPVRAFDELVTQATRGGGRIQMLKLDCEGSEWPILLTSRMLHLVDSICGEYHLGTDSEPFAVAGYPAFTPHLLDRYLSEHGFEVRLQESKNPCLGLFFAERTARKAATPTTCRRFEAD